MPSSGHQWEVLILISTRKTHLLLFGTQTYIHSEKLNLGISHKPNRHNSLKWHRKSWRIIYWDTCSHQNTENATCKFVTSNKLTLGGRATIWGNLLGFNLHINSDVLCLFFFGFFCLNYFLKELLSLSLWFNRFGFLCFLHVEYVFPNGLKRICWPLFGPIKSLLCLRF